MGVEKNEDTAFNTVVFMKPRLASLDPGSFSPAIMFSKTQVDISSVEL